MREKCGVFGVVSVSSAANFTALGLHALQHRGQEAGGIVVHDPKQGFNSVRRFRYVRDNFTDQATIDMHDAHRHWPKFFGVAGIPSGAVVNPTAHALDAALAG